MRIGEFDPPEIVPYAGIKPGIINDPSHNDLAVEIATKTPVLLKTMRLPKPEKKHCLLMQRTLKRLPY